MIFKVFYQDSAMEAPVREKTKVLYVEGESERDIRTKLSPFHYNIEFIQELAGAHLEYEKQSENFKVTEYA
ncbi:DNA-directed RNA polymerase subunit epsilon [Ectobacillus antri]|jgi:DNA-dependent RNA polymerase auxiliary subunit epsilon|uniref:DNA-directed RNA polymerase subunit epsilon n=1 Tax=Ectobacillus antri TaxID=2486280 RepID=A0ABT6GZM4_9BACI|nr:DNA-directed RNA polymerase subunit epsilon [Ectobacillus antri]MDG4655771.1 DNA-directed RNA polymerase subunit epsilon [Ectobacillus antri]MDG5752446.1 DNA-directed RNA polymerase subunit epsilon [Ectobacillus antri]